MPTAARLPTTAPKAAPEPDWKTVAQVVMQQRDSVTTQLYEAQINLNLAHQRLNELEKTLQLIQPQAEAAD